MGGVRSRARSAIVIGGAVFLGTLSLLPPAVPADPPPEVFSTDAARAHVEVIGAEPHPMGSPEIEEVRDYLVAELERLGLSPELQRVEATSPSVGQHQVRIALQKAIVARQVTHHQRLAQ